MNYAALFIIVFVGVWYWRADVRIANYRPATEIEEAIRWSRNCYYDGNTPEECVRLWREVK